MELLQAIEQIIAKKRVEHRRPLHATSYQVFEATGLNREEQLRLVKQLEREGVVVVGKTFNSMYYQLVEVMV